MASEHLASIGRNSRHAHSVGDPKTDIWRWLDLRASCGNAELDSEHMANDAELLRQTGAGLLTATIRCYTWNNASVTFGRMQDEAAVAECYGDLPHFRRPTGGKAVLHGQDLTIAVCASNDFLQGWGTPRAGAKTVYTTYLKLIEPIREALSSFGAETRMGTEQCRLGAESSGDLNSEDCFAYSAKCDLVDALTEKKLLGSAMRRTSAAVLLQLSLKPISGIDVVGDPFVARLRERYQTR